MENNERYRKLTLLHSNDMHGDFLAETLNNNLVGGVSMLSGYISKVKEEEKNVLYCVAGDMFRGSIIDSEYKGVSTVEIMNMLSPDVVTIGNHETDYGLAHLLFIEKCARFPIINANLFIKMNGKRLFEPYKIIEIDGMKILFIGILTDDVISTTKKDSVVGSLVDINDAAEEVSKICNTFNGIDIDFTVLLTHIGFDKDKELAAKLDKELGVDVIIGGHSHTFLDKPEKVNDILIVQAGIGTDQIGRFDIVVDTDNNCVASYKWESVPINADNCPRDPKMEKLVDAIKSETDLKYGRTLRRLKCVLHHPTRYNQTVLGSFVSDIVKKQLGLDLFLFPSGAIREAKIGPILTLQDSLETFPFKESIYEMRIKGHQLKKMLEYVYRDEGFDPNADTEFFQLSNGFYVEYNKSLHKITKFEYEGKQIEDEQIFSVGLPSYHFLSFDSIFNLSIEDIKKNFEPKKICTDYSQMLAEYFGSEEPLPDYPAEDRLVIVDEK